MIDPTLYCQVGTSAFRGRLGGKRLNQTGQDFCLWEGIGHVDRDNFDLGFSALWGGHPK